jgi:hypothetical protein
MHRVRHALHNHHAVYNQWVDAQGRAHCWMDTLFTTTTLFTQTMAEAHAQVEVLALVLLE